MKLFYPALRNLSQKWTMLIRDWKAALTRFAIQFEERIPQIYSETPFTQKFGQAWLTGKIANRRFTNFIPLLLAKNLGHIHDIFLPNLQR